MVFLKSILLLLHLLTSLPSTLQSPQCPSHPTPQDTHPHPLFSLPKTYSPTPQQPQSPSTLDKIRTTLSLYPLCIDGKNFAALDRVFTPTAIANYSAPIFVLNGLAAIQARIEKALERVDTQHSYGTQVVRVLGGGCEAVAVTYLTATHFGRGVYEGEVFYAYGQYQDILVRVGEGEGEWRIRERNLIYMVSFEFCWEGDGDGCFFWGDLVVLMTFLGAFDR